MRATTVRRPSIQTASAFIGLVTGLGTLIGWISDKAPPPERLLSYLGATALGTAILLIYSAQIVRLAKKGRNWWPAEDADQHEWNRLTGFLLASPIVGSALGIYVVKSFKGGSWSSFADYIAGYFLPIGIAFLVTWGIAELFAWFAGDMGTSRD